MAQQTAKPRRTNKRPKPHFRCSPDELHQPDDAELFTRDDDAAAQLHGMHQILGRHVRPQDLF